MVMEGARGAAVLLGDCAQPPPTASRADWTICAGAGRRCSEVSADGPGTWPGRGKHRWVSYLPLGPGGSCGSVWVFVLAPEASLAGALFRRPLEHERVIGRHEGVWCHHRIGVVDGAVLPRKGDPPRALAQAVLQLGSDLLGPLPQLLRRIVDHRLDLVDL